MNKCNIIRDILPLYIDGVCSEDSTNLIKEHIADCRECASFLKELQGNEEESELIIQKDEVLKKQARYFRRRTTAVGAVIAGILLVPVIVCLIVNLCVGATLDWFFIVLSAMLLTASLTVLPLIAPKNRYRITLGAFSACLVLLFGVVCLYTGGNWFFTASLATLFGLSVAFFPFALKGIKGSAFIWLITVTALYTSMMFSIYMTVRDVEFIKIAFAFSLPIAALIWINVLLCAYLPFHPLTKAGICIILCSGFICFANEIFAALLRAPARSVPPTELWMVFAGAATVGIIFIVIGIIRKRGLKK